MWNLPKGNKFLPKTTLKELETLYTAEKKAKPKTRLLCAIHRKKGATIDEIAEITNQKRAVIFLFFSVTVNRTLLNLPMHRRVGK